ncbi:MAG: hypothetical protein ABL928_05055 [Sphingorhabdus sp.]
MTLAMKKLKNFGWVALLSVIIVLLYPMSLNVGALHSELVSTDRKIMETKREISFLQAELKTRANMAQLAEWNDLLYGYGPPTADQFLAGERALANLDGIGPDVKPVMVAVSDMDGIVPAGEIGKPGGFASKLAEDEDEPVRIAAATIQKPKLPETLSAAKPVGRTERLSKMDDQLLSDKTLKEIEKKAAQERNRR